MSFWEDCHSHSSLEMATGFNDELTQTVAIQNEVKVPLQQKRVSFVKQRFFAGYFFHPFEIGVYRSEWHVNSIVIPDEMKWRSGIHVLIIHNKWIPDIFFWKFRNDNKMKSHYPPTLAFRRTAEEWDDDVNSIIFPDRIKWRSGIHSLIYQNVLNLPTCTVTTLFQN